MARLYREAPLNSVWEGTANMMCMDVRRAMLKDPRTIDALFDETRPLAGQDARFDAMVRHAERLVREGVEDEFLARPMTEAVARVLQGAELLRHSTQEVTEVFLSTRNPGTAGSWGSHYGTLAVTVTQPVAKTIMQRAMVSD
jgi:putative acyl-CoA dehydrogenase